MKTLYISDLDGTLIHSDAKISEFTANTINNLVENGLIFSYATARSWHTSTKVTEGLKGRLPIILYNGAFVLENESKDIIVSNFFHNDTVRYALDTLLKNDIYPLVYSLDGNDEHFNFVNEDKHITWGLRHFLDSRGKDPRYNPVCNADELYKDNIFYFTCIDEPDKLEPLYELFKADERLNCVYQVDIYSKAQWLEIMPKAASKRNAVLQLKEILGCDKVVCFGDGKNDISMFEIADECYAVANAADELKTIATGIIGSNNDDGVAKWLLENTYLQEK